MAGFIKALRSEFFLARRSRSLKALFLLPALAGALRVALGALIGASEQARQALAGKGGSAAASTNAYGPFVDGVSAGWTLGVLVFAAAAAFGLSSRRELGALRQVLIQGSSRLAVALASFVFLLAASLASIALLYVSAAGTAACFYDFGAAVEDGFEIFSAREIRGEIVLASLLALAPLPATLALGLVFALAARTAVEAVGSTLGCLLFIDFFKGLLGSAAHFVPSAYQPSLFDRSYLAEAAKLARGYSDVLVEEGLLRLNALVPLPWTAALVFLALAIASRRSF